MPIDLIFYTFDQIIINFDQKFRFFFDLIEFPNSNYDFGDSQRTVRGGSK